MCNILDHELAHDNHKYWIYIRSPITLYYKTNNSKVEFVASELKNSIWHSLEWQIGSFSCEATNCINSFNPHDALKHHFTSLKTNLIFLQQRVLERKSHENGLPIHGNFLEFFKPHQIIFIHYKSRIATAIRGL